MDTEPPSPGWRSPVLWLVLGLPLATVAGGLWTLRIAAGAEATDAAPEPVQRTAQVQLRDFGPDLAAARAGLQAQLHREADGSYTLSSEKLASEDLQLDLVHPLDAARDQHLRLVPVTPGQWRSASAAQEVAAWHLRLMPTDRRWRLVGRLDADQVLLQPAVVAQ